MDELDCPSNIMYVLFIFVHYMNARQLDLTFIEMLACKDDYVISIILFLRVFTEISTFTNIHPNCLAFEIYDV